MRLLLDTHTLLWATDDNAELRDPARREIERAENIVFVSMATLWELQIKKSLGKLELPDEFFDGLESAGYELLPVSLEHLKTLDTLPLHHRDPFDRMLIAQALSEKLVLVSRDEQIRKYDVEILKA